MDLVGLSEQSLLSKVNTLCLVNLLHHSLSNNLSHVITNQNLETQVVMVGCKKMLLTTLKHTVSSLIVIILTHLAAVKELLANLLVIKPMVKSKAGHNSNQVTMLLLLLDWLYKDLSLLL